MKPGVPDVRGLCVRRPAGFGGYVDCLTEGGHRCPEALHFGAGRLCLHPERGRMVGDSEAVRAPLEDAPRPSANHAPPWVPTPPVGIPSDGPPTRPFPPLSAPGLARRPPGWCRSEGGGHDDEPDDETIPSGASRGGTTSHPHV